MPGSAADLTDTKPAAADGNKLPAGVNGRRAKALIAALAAVPLQPELII